MNDISYKPTDYSSAENWFMNDFSENKGSRVNNIEALSLSGKPFTMDDVKDEIYEP